MKFLTSITMSALSVGLLLLHAAESQAQRLSGEEFAQEFRDHVVKVQATWADGQKQEGFGFVVGQNEMGVYIVTANHVVRRAGPDQVAEIVKLTWFRRRGEQFPATPIGTNDADRDIAVLRTELPTGVELRPELMKFVPGSLQRQTQVWFVGRGGDWYVPSQFGTVNSVDLNEQIHVDGLNLQVGTSGAPLITEGGVAGVLIEDAGGVAKATAVSFLARAFDAWAHPWNMTTMSSPEKAAANEDNTSSMPSRSAAAVLDPEFTLKATIEDPDGYTNLRSGRGTHFQVIARVTEGEIFRTSVQDAPWWQVRTANGTIGFMHRSRIRLID